MIFLFINLKFLTYYDALVSLGQEEPFPIVEKFEMGRFFQEEKLRFEISKLDSFEKILKNYSLKKNKEK